MAFVSWRVGSVISAREGPVGPGPAAVLLRGGGVSSCERTLRGVPSAGLDPRGPTRGLPAATKHSSHGALPESSLQAPRGRSSPAGPSQATPSSRPRWPTPGF